MRANSGLVTRRELEALGFTQREVTGLLAHGDLRRLHRGVFADGRAPLSDRAHLKAALLALRGERWLSGHAAAAGWGLELPSLIGIEVTVVASCTPTRRGLRITRTSRPPHPSELVTRNGLRISSVPRMLIEVAASGAEERQLENLIEQALRRKLLDIHDLAATLARHQGRPGSAAVRRLSAEYLPRVDRKSGLERAFDRWLARHPEIPEPQRNIRLGPWEIDCYWPDQRLAVELDGRPYHVLIEEIERDHRKDAWLQAHHIRILRVTDARFRQDRHGAHRDLTMLLGLSHPDPANQVALGLSQADRANRIAA